VEPHPRSSGEEREGEEVSDDPAKKEIATVYRSLNGRRYFTRHWALVHSAWQLILRRCSCEEETGFRCGYHRFDDLGPDGYSRCYGERLAYRFAKFYRRKK
jgi:hypothetical protein